MRLQLTAHFDSRYHRNHRSDILPRYDILAAYTAYTLFTTRSVHYIN